MKTNIAALGLLVNMCWITLGAETLLLENESLARALSVQNGVLKTLRVENKLNHQTLVPDACDEFRMRLSTNVDSLEPDILLTAADFEVMSFTGDVHAIVAELRNVKHGLLVKVHYTLAPGKTYGHKDLEITSSKPWTLELVDIESLACADAYSPYKAKDMMLTSGKFLPALGQPLYTSKSAMFWGVEFPAAWNRLEGQTIRCGYQRGIELQPGIAYSTHSAVFGVADDSAFIKDAFLKYIDEVRATPVELRIQYNSWFDFGGGVSQSKFLETLKILHEELVTKRGCRPLDVYVIDDGWQNSRPPRTPLADWSTGIFPVNEASFDKDLVTLRKDIEARGSKMGLWASPCSIFGARANIDVLEKNGFEVLVGGTQKKSDALSKSMSMTGPKYTALLEKRLLELVQMGAVHFKLDGIFGDLVSRYFETKPNRGTPVISHLLPKDMTANDQRWNDPKFDEMKRYYITAATERLMDIFDKMHRLNPQVHILCHNGATVSPWWLMHMDVLSLVNMHDHAAGEGRTEQMCYRDELYYQLSETDGNQVPLCSFFNHEPAKVGTRHGDATADGFRDYLFMALSRGTTTVELYLGVKSVKPEEFDVLAEGLKWLYQISPAFKRARMHGGAPYGSGVPPDESLSVKKLDIDRDAQVYGYTGWTDKIGYVSIHNPTSSVKTYSFCLDRKFGLVPGSGPFQLSSALPHKDKGLKKTWSFGETVNVELQPREVLVFQFEKEPKEGKTSQ